MTRKRLYVQVVCLVSIPSCWRVTCDELWGGLGGSGDSTCNYSVAILVNGVMLVSLWTEPMKFVEGNASVYQVKSVSPISGEGRVCGGGSGGRG